MKNANKIRAVISVFIMLTMFAVPFAGATPCETYTTDADFDEGTLVGVEHETVHDQLQLNTTATTLPFIWVPNSNQGTISKVNTSDGRELGRYRVGPTTVYPNPSRTTVDLQGDCWVGNRRIGTVVKVGLDEAGQCVDRNTNGVIDTSRDTNNDGDITGAELLAWGADECVLYEVVLIPGKVGTHIPGTYVGGYENNDWLTSPRGLAIDASNNLWAGTWNPCNYFYIDGSTGAILNSINVPNHNAYGAVIDRNGILWSSGQQRNHVLSLDPSTTPPTISTLNMGHFVYGLGMDNIGHLFISGWTDSKLSRVNVGTGLKDWTTTGVYQTRGVAVTSIDNDVWTASTWAGAVTRYNNSGNWKAAISVGNSPTGVAVDAAGKVWSVNMDGYIYRIDPSTNSVDLTKLIAGQPQHYGYSDMTGIVARSVTTKIGTWTVGYDSGVIATPWGTVSWTSDEPAGTSVTVKVRSSNDKISWSVWETATSGCALSSTPNGRYLQIETTLQIISGDTSPILYDLTVCSSGGGGPTVESADVGGTPQNIFQPVSPVYAIGSGYTPSTVYNLHVVNDNATWTNGMPIPTRVAGTATTVTTDGSGDIPAGTQIWDSCVQGKYDIVVDVDGNNQYDVGIDALDANVDVGFEAVPEFSTIAIPVMSILGLLFFFNHRKRKREQ